jgi:uncharacterized membrane protein YjgN (DUF898 family)
MSHQILPLEFFVDDLCDGALESTTYGGQIKIKPDLEAEIQVRPAELTVRKSPLRDGIIGYFDCRIVLSSGTWDCRMVFPQKKGRVELGETTIARIQMLVTKEVLLGMAPGDSFELRETDVIATGTITALLTVPLAKRLKLEFNGSSIEYFRIWAVNLCLTLLTLGIFSAWAKVRKKRYFYSHTLLDGTPFQYLGQPLPILKGRLVAVSLFAVYYISTHFLTTALPYVLAIGGLLAPWVIVRSSAFNARYSAYRNMTFRFDGNYRQAAQITCAWGLVPLFIAGMIFHWWKASWLQTSLLVLACLLYPCWIGRLTRFVVGHTEYGDRKGALTATGWQFFKIYLWAAAIFVLVIMLGAAGVGVKSKVLLMLPIYAGYLLSYAYLKAGTGNLVWSRTAIGPLRFTSTLCGWALATYYLTNGLAIAASCGLLTPWAVMRTMRYRADNLHVFLAGELSEFSGSNISSVGATGAEVGEFFDMDLSI